MIKDDKLLEDWPSRDRDFRWCSGYRIVDYELTCEEMRNSA